MCNKMSDVRLSNASPTVERVDARQPDAVRPPVRRSLFGSPDRGEIRRYLESAIQDDVQDFRERYNFDPVDDRPLTPRNFEWQEDGDAPEFYRREPHGSQRRRDAEGSEGQAARPAERGGERKRRSADSGPCSGECPSKRRSHTDDDDDEDDEAHGADAAAAAAAAAGVSQEEEERASRPETSQQVQ